jgi:serine protease Do
MTKTFWAPRFTVSVLTVVLGLLSVTAVADPPAPDVERLVRRAIYEVIVPKPPNDPLTYEKPLPLDLIPFAIRNDAFIPIGTAFAIGSNRYVTAAHVILAVTRRDPASVFLRGSDGKTYEIGKVLNLSFREDFVVFTLRDDPGGPPLRVNDAPSIGATVYAVGNALGEGIVIRDGLLTSETPEDRSGEWKWLRFSAPASPGNSGGPLLATDGSVVGVVVAKSPNENLNFALPIGHVVNPTGAPAARFDIRQSLKTGLTSSATTVTHRASFPLPKPYGEFATETNKLDHAFVQDFFAQYAADHADTLFPKGAGSQKLLFTAYETDAVTLITQQDDGTWDVVEPKGLTTMDLSGGGKLRLGSSGGWLAARLTKPDGIAVGTLFSDSTVFGDLILKGAKLTRPVGDQAIRITSFGKALHAEWLTDNYGRRWLLRTWPLPFTDAVAICIALPQPGGAAVLMAITPIATADSVVEQGRLIVNYAYVNYYGTLDEWRAFLADKTLPPAAFDGLKIDVDFHRAFNYRSKRLAFSVLEAMQSIAPDSPLTLKMGYFEDKGHVTWDVVGVSLADTRKERTYVKVSRIPRPPPARRDESLNWDQMMRLQGEFDERPHTHDGSTWMEYWLGKEAPVTASTPEGIALVYQVTQVFDASIPAQTMENTRHQVRSALRILE